MGCIEGTDESTPVMDSSVPLMNYDPSDLGLLILIQITPKERTISLITGRPLYVFVFNMKRRESMRVMNEALKIAHLNNISV